VIPPLPKNRLLLLLGFTPKKYPKKTWKHKTQRSFFTKKNRVSKHTNQKKLPKKNDLNQRNRNLNQPTSPTAEIPLEGREASVGTTACASEFPPFFRFWASASAASAFNALLFSARESRDPLKISRIFWREGLPNGVKIAKIFELPPPRHQFFVEVQNLKLMEGLTL